MPRKLCFKQIPLESILMEKIDLNRYDFNVALTKHEKKLKIILNLSAYYMYYHLFSFTAH